MIQATSELDCRQSQLFVSERFTKYVQERDHQDPCRIQLKCRNQFLADGGGVASCGYHALRNGILLAKAVHRPQLVNQCLGDLHSERHQNALFGRQQSPWCSFIARQRRNANEPQQGSDWLSGEEMQQLISREKSSEGLLGIFRDMKGLLIATYGDTTGNVVVDAKLLVALNKGLGDKTDSDSFVVGDFPELKIVMRTTQDDVIGVVLVYVAPERSWFGRQWDSWWGGPDDGSRLNAANTNGHWFALVVCRLRGQTQYLIADSAANHKRLRDRKVNEIIELFEGGTSQAGAGIKAGSVATVAPASSMQVQSGEYQVASANPSMPQQAALVTGMSLPAKIASAAVLGLAAYGGYTLYQRYIGQNAAQDTNADTTAEISPNTSVQVDFLI